MKTYFLAFKTYPDCGHHVVVREVGYGYVEVACPCRTMDEISLETTTMPQHNTTVRIARYGWTACDASETPHCAVFRTDEHGQETLRIADVYITKEYPQDVAERIASSLADYLNKEVEP